MTDVSTSAKAENTPVKSIRAPLTTRQRRQRRCLRSLLLVAFSILCLNAGITSALIYWQTPETVTFDMKGTIDRFTGQLTAQDLDEGKVKALTARFTTALATTLQTWQQSHDALILVQPAVVGGARDITPDIQSRVAEAMSVSEEG
ncbi:type-F conjugative transfer system protein TrbI [Klebsiella aerogenes]|uniref:type-F conjugative transfer system protein TrbI n=1 Tax=Klebsiella aerogenes TaxID=548 RepID=UPI002E2F8510|nr:type-F conjugative transfer system protein TrbI [Klebsiella aerogenes]MED7793162.1 type-F conjugative transfer system protein TrbI [Klebsiella aerogenes]